MAEHHYRGAFPHMPTSGDYPVVVSSKFVGRRSAASGSPYRRLAENGI